MIFFTLKGREGALLSYPHLEAYLSCCLSVLPDKLPEGLSSVYICW